MMTPRALKRSVLAAAVALACWVGWVGARIEVLNAAAGSYLPRRDGYDGKWRVSPGGSAPRDRLRGLVGTLGLGQYLLAPGCVAAGLFAAASGDRPGWRRAGGACAVVGAAALGSALYRDYLGSLGW